MKSSLEPLPKALPSMWRLLKLGYRHEPRLMLGSFALSQLAALPDALLPLWIKLLGEGVIQADRRLMLASALALGVSATLTWFLATVSTRVQRRFRDKVTIALESHVANHTHDRVGLGVAALQPLADRVLAAGVQLERWA